MGSLGTCCHILPIKFSSCLPSQFVDSGPDEELLVWLTPGRMPTLKCSYHPWWNLAPLYNILLLLLALQTALSHPTQGFQALRHEPMAHGEKYLSLQNKVHLFKVSEGKDELIHVPVLIIYQILHIWHFLINLISFDIGFTPSCSQKFPTAMEWKSQWTFILFATVYS